MKLLGSYVWHLLFPVKRNEMLGWYQGRVEFGPRALGNRSILADRPDPEMKAKVNNTVKFREWWRPLAPSFKKEAAPEYLESAYDSPFMILTAPVRPEKREVIPSVTHIDGSARPQTVEKKLILLLPAHRRIRQTHRSAGNTEHFGRGTCPATASRTPQGKTCKSCSMFHNTSPGCSFYCGIGQQLFKMFDKKDGFGLARYGIGSAKFRTVLPNGSRDARLPQSVDYDVVNQHI